MTEITFFVEGNPVAKQSFKVSRSGGRVMGFTPARVKSWQEAVAWTAQRRMRALRLDEPIDGNLTVRLTFFLKDARRIDSDNLSKCVLDGLNQVVWIDDRQVIDLIITKYICRDHQGVLVRVESNPRRMELSLAEINIIRASALPYQSIDLTGATL
jgi:Holliday junction resolvase RusA-like endonuclease